MRALNRRFWHGCGWGAVATIVMTVVLLAAWRLWPAGVPAPMPLAITIGIVARVFDAQQMATGVIVLAALLQFAYGAIWGGLFEASIARATPAKGIALGLGLWLMMGVFYMPMAGQDVFAVATSSGIWISTLLGHVIYGYVLGRLLARDQRRVPVPDEAVAV